MGIQGLLPLLKDIQVKTHMSNFKGQTVGIDVYCWLHKGAYSCAMDIALGKSTKAYVYYCMRRVEMLIANDVTPIMVFDGGHLPAKADTEKKRREEKKKYKAVAFAAMNEGNEKSAFEMFQRCVDICPEMASEVIQACYRLNVQCIVAPYEADAQLAYLMKEGITQLTISEDSDLLLYGCNKVMYKMSAEGEGYVVDLEHLANVKTVQLASFTLEKFRHMCMLSGCDYLPSMKGMGLMTAYKAIRRFPNAKQCIKSLKCNPKFSVPKDYEEKFRKADIVFKYQLVFDIRSQTLVRLHDVSELDTFEKAEKDYAGPMLDPERGIQIALGNIDPISGKTLASLTNFASGVISRKSSGWDSPPPPDTSTSFKFRGDRGDSSQKQTKSNTKQTNKTRKSTGDSPTHDPWECDADPFVDIPKPVTTSPAVQASKSLKRLLEEDEPGPTREEKIRKLYGEDPTEHEDDGCEGDEGEGEDKRVDVDENEDDDLLFTASAPLPRKQYNLFSKKSLPAPTFKSSSFKLRRSSDGGGAEKIVTSKFFSSNSSSKVGNEKSPNVCDLDTPSPRRVVVSDDEKRESPSTQKKGSFIDYLDHTNVRGYEVPPPLTLSETRKSLPKQTKIASPKKMKRKNIFAVKKGGAEVQSSTAGGSCEASSCSPDTNSKGDNKTNNINNKQNNINSSSNNNEDDISSSSKENDGGCVGNIDFNITNPLNEQNQNDHQEDKSKEEKSSQRSGEKSISQLFSSQSSSDVKKTVRTAQEELDDFIKKNPKPKKKSLLSHFQYKAKSKPKHSAGDKELYSTVTERKKSADVQKVNLVEDSDDEGASDVHEVRCGDVIEQSSKNKHIDLDNTSDAQSSTVDLVEENVGETEQSNKSDIVELAETPVTICEVGDRKETMQSKELDEEPLPSHLSVKVPIPNNNVVGERDNDEDDEVAIVKSLSFPITAKTKSKLQGGGLGKCRTMGLSKKRKQSKPISEGGSKQMTFEKFAFKKKSVS